MPQFLVLFLSFWKCAQSNNIEAFLDHGGHPYHAEVFYSVANLVQQLHPTQNITFVIHEDFARNEGLVELYHKYGQTGPINPFYFRFDQILSYTPLAGREHQTLLCHPDFLSPKYWMRVVVTVANLPGVSECLAPYANSSSYLFIIHHPTSRSGGGGHDGSLLPWRNAYVASNAAPIYELTSRHFSPALLPLSPGRPNCSQPPIFIIQGDPERRNFMEVKWMLETEHPFTLRIMNRYLVRTFNDHRVQYIENSTLLYFHEAFLDAAFLLPLIAPSVGRTRSYFHGRSTSSVAFAAHFRLRFLAHAAVNATFHHELKSWTHYWHNGSKASFLKAFRAGLEGFSKWCRYSQEQPWG
jgi:hypothetical protein